MWKITEKIAHNPLVLLLMMSIIALVSCGKTQSGGSLVDKYSGEEIFKAVYFADGELASKISIIKKSMDVRDFLKDESEMAGFRNVQNELIAAIAQQNAGFMAHFEAMMKSHDPQKIKEAMVSGSEVLELALKNRVAASSLPDQVSEFLANEGKNLPLNKEGRKKLDEHLGTAASFDNGRCLYEAVVIVVVGAVAVGIYLWVTITKYMPKTVDEPPIYARQSHSLFAEEVAMAIATL